MSGPPTELNRSPCPEQPVWSAHPARTQNGSRATPVPMEPVASQSDDFKFSVLSGVQGSAGRPAADGR